LLRPFKRSNGDPTRRGLWQMITEPSESEMDDADEVVGIARSFREWNSMSFAKNFRLWVRAQAEKPSEVGDHMTMITGATRSNTFREVLKYLSDLETRADQALGENDNG